MFVKRFITQTIRRNPILQSKRKMSGHHAPAQGEQDGIETFVRRYLPENEHVKLT